ncbi:MAG: class I SAM-dependent methyltransferase [Actinomycetota bacterium]|jgi:hypothetical protein|nr:class I SAM-dependent methyltransferase [Actinomycetota bacterium]
MRPYWDEQRTGTDVPVHRKIWEWAFIANALDENDMLRPGRTGLGFGVGKEPLVPLFASLGCHVVATDQSTDAAISAGWSGSNQFAGNLNSLNELGLCDQQLFESLVTFQTVDMREIPADLKDFDFTWSSCALEHLGTIEEGIEFVLKQMACLRAGGIAVHTTEFNISSNRSTVDAGPTVLFRKGDLERLSRLVKNNGDAVKLDFTLGSTEADNHIDRPPWSGAHLRLEHSGFVITSFGLVIRKGRGSTKTPMSRMISRLSRTRW